MWAAGVLVCELRFHLVCELKFVLVCELRFDTVNVNCELILYVDRTNQLWREL